MTVFTATSSTTWLCPPNVFTVACGAWGMFGAGGTSVHGSKPGAGGGGGAYSFAGSVAVTPGNTYSIFVDATSARFVGDSITVAANSGTSAVSNTPGTGGAITAGMDVS